jgi:hypothetical protein
LGEVCMKEYNRRVLYSLIVILTVIGLFLSLLFIIGAGFLVLG